MENFSFILSVFGLALFIISLLIKGKNMKLILFLNFLGNLVIAISYFTAGNGINGAVSSCIGGAISIINYVFDSNNKRIPIWLIVVYILVFGCVNLVVTSSWRVILALFASFAFVAGVVQNNGRKYRIWMSMNSCFWIAYDIVTASYGPLMTHIILFAFSLTGMLIHDLKLRHNAYK